MDGCPHVGLLFARLHARDGRYTYGVRRYGTRAGHDLGSHPSSSIASDLPSWSTALSRDLARLFQPHSFDDVLGVAVQADRFRGFTDLTSSPSQSTRDPVRPPLTRLHPSASVANPPTPYSYQPLHERDQPSGTPSATSRPLRPGFLHPRLTETSDQRPHLETPNPPATIAKCLPRPPRPPPPSPRGPSQNPPSNCPAGAATTASAASFRAR